MEHFDIAIIGTGSGNTIVDEHYANKKVAICEQGVFGGTCLNVGCIPTKMFVYAAEVAQTVREAARYGVDAHIDGVRWTDIVSRVFGRIDPLAMGGEHYRRSLPNVTVYDSHTTFAGRAEDATEENTCANSAATNPPPMITRCSGSSARRMTVSLVWNSTPHPAIASGTMARAPAAMTTCSAVNSSPSAVCSR